MEWLGAASAELGLVSLLYDRMLASNALGVTSQVCAGCLGAQGGVACRGAHAGRGAGASTPRLLHPTPALRPDNSASCVLFCVFCAGSEFPGDDGPDNTPSLGRIPPLSHCPRHLPVTPEVPSQRSCWHAISACSDPLPPCVRKHVGQTRPRWTPCCSVPRGMCACAHFPLGIFTGVCGVGGCEFACSPTVVCEPRLGCASVAARSAQSPAWRSEESTRPAEVTHGSLPSRSGPRLHTDRLCLLSGALFSVVLCTLATGCFKCPQAQCSLCWASLATPVVHAFSNCPSSSEDRHCSAF